MKTISRRGLLRASAGLGGIAVAGGLVPWNLMAADEQAKVAQPHMKFPAVPRQRLAVATWPFRAEIEAANNEYRDKKKPGMDLRDFCAGVRKKFDVPGVEPLSAHFPSTDENYLKRFREAIEKAGVHIVDIPVDSHQSFYDPDAAKRKQAIDNGKKWVDIAVIVGSPSIRTSIAEVPNAKPNVEMAASALRELADYAATRDVQINLENDDLVSEDALFIVKVLETARHPYLHALPDFCNSMLSGNEQFNYLAVTAMFQHAYNICHVKDAEVGEQGKVYRIDLKQTFHILRVGKYRGYLSMEFEGEGDPYEGTKKLIAVSLQWLV
jgi:sugar phosphate isomerase/epimerase